MAEREDAPSDGLITGASDWHPDEEWDADARYQPEDGWDWHETSYNEWSDTAVAPESPRWYGRPGILTALIIVAMVALVVASVLLLTNARFGEQDEMRLQPTIRTSSITLPSRTAPARAPESAPTTATTSGEPTPSSAPEEPAAIGAPEPQAPPATPGPGAVGAQTPPSKTPEGPRTNVTRNPMSFTPGG